MKKIAKLLSALASATLLSVLFSLAAFAQDPTDEILRFEITADVNEDATVNFRYHIDWLVLDSETFGPLEWVKIGAPNSNHTDVQALSETITDIRDQGNEIRIELDRPYYAGETVSFEYSFTQGNLYQIGRYVEGETVYIYTPAWFDGIFVDDLTVRWNQNKAGAWQPDADIEGDYLVFQASLSPGEKFELTVAYPNDAFAFTPEGEMRSGTGGSDGNSEDSPLVVILAIIIVMVFIIAPIAFVVFIIRFLISVGRGFGSSTDTVKKIIRTKIEYYDNCPNCGAVREEGQEKCEYCKTSFEKSREVVEENEIKNPQKYSTDGTYRYEGSPHTFIHVNTINVPRPRSSAGSSARRSGGCASSCASSCASGCACASSCACACACASSGRAGCSVKDFFDKEKHNLKVRSYHENEA